MITLSVKLFNQINRVESRLSGLAGRKVTARKNIVNSNPFSSKNF